MRENTRDHCTTLRFANENFRLVSKKKKKKEEEENVQPFLRFSASNRGIPPQWEDVQLDAFGSFYPYNNAQHCRRVPRIICRTAVSLRAFRTVKLLFIRRTLAGVGEGERRKRAERLA